MTLQRRLVRAVKQQARGKLWVLAIAMGLPTGAGAVTPYTPISLPPGATPGIGPGVIAPGLVFGKEYSHDADETVGGVADPERIIAWDGIGGTMPGLDYTGSRGPNDPREQQVDAAANRNDALFQRLRQDRAHLIFSHDDEIAMYSPGAGPVWGAGALPSAGPVLLSNGETIGGTGELSVEESGVYTGAPPEVQHLWAKAAEINDMPLPVDVDAVEVWGPEPGDKADADKYSLETDATNSGVSVWNYNLTTLMSSPYLLHDTIADAVEHLLGAVPGGAHNRFFQDGRAAINLDALMVREVFNEDPNPDPDADDIFDYDPTGGPTSDQIIFSINQIVSPNDPDLYYATGSELFVLSAKPTPAGFPSVSYLRHGGHEWSHSYTLGAMGVAGFGPDQRAYIDINAIEAVGALIVPEPGAVLLLGLGAVFCAGGRRRR